MAAVFQVAAYQGTLGHNLYATEKERRQPVPQEMAGILKKWNDLKSGWCTSAPT